MLKIGLVYFGQTPGEQRPSTHVDTLTGVRIAGIGNSGSHGPEPQMVRIPLLPMNIFWNGRDIFGHKG
ncbi:MAG TPA: hypothetical protein VJN18_14470 [Polyangiaceae bacterium]|nr:hypothetical protein [Polyangiaceae bacterium]